MKALLSHAKNLARRRPLWAATVLLILLSGTYWGLLATDRFVSEANIVVMSSDLGAGGFNVKSLLAGTAGSRDLLHLRDHLLSVDMMRLLDAEHGLRQHYAAKGIDIFSRLRSEDVSIEQFHRYYQRRIHVDFDEYVGALRVRVEAYEQEKAQAIAHSLLVEGEKHINDMSRRLAEEQVQFIERQVTALEQRLFEAQDRMLAYQNEHGLVSPTDTVSSRSEIVSRLESELALLTARRNALIQSRSRTAPEVVRMSAEIDALRKQITDESARLAARTGDTLNRISAQYEALALQFKFAQELYSNALVSLEAARVESVRNMKQISILQTPTYPEYSVSPRRVYMSTVYALILLSIAIVIQLFTAIVKDHRD